MIKNSKRFLLTFARTLAATTMFVSVGVPDEPPTDTCVSGAGGGTANPAECLVCPPQAQGGSLMLVPAYYRDGWNRPCLWRPGDNPNGIGRWDTNTINVCGLPPDRRNAALVAELPDGVIDPYTHEYLEERYRIELSSGAALYNDTDYCISHGEPYGEPHPVPVSYVHTWQENEREFADGASPTAALDQWITTGVSAADTKVTLTVHDLNLKMYPVSGSASDCAWESPANFGASEGPATASYPLVFYRPRMKLIEGPSDKEILGVRVVEWKDSKGARWVVTMQVRGEPNAGTFTWHPIPGAVCAPSIPGGDAKLTVQWSLGLGIEGGLEAGPKAILAGVSFIVSGNIQVSFATEFMAEGYPSLITIVEPHYELYTGRLNFVTTVTKDGEVWVPGGDPADNPLAGVGGWIGKLMLGGAPQLVTVVVPTGKVWGVPVRMRGGGSRPVDSVQKVVPQ